MWPDIISILFAAFIVYLLLGRSPNRSGGVIVKDNPTSKKPKIGKAPQPIPRNNDK